MREGSFAGERRGPVDGRGEHLVFRALIDRRDEGEHAHQNEYTKRRINAFGITFGEIPDDWFALGAGAILMGYPVISDFNTTPEVRPTGVTVRKALVVEPDYARLVPTCVDTRGVKVKIEKIDIPVGYAAAFEGERMRKDDMQLQFGFKYSEAVEYVTWSMAARLRMAASKSPARTSTPCRKAARCRWRLKCLWPGERWQRDFEGILERQIHRWLSHAMGFMHTGQRPDLVPRQQKAYQSGLRLKHLGTILYAKVHDEYSGIVDKVAVRITSAPDAVAAKVSEAREAFCLRDDRIAGMTDESVDTFYSCTICQSYAPDHVCVITPQRLGLCGAYNWLDGRANYEINPVGPNQPIAKGRTIDNVKGEWEGVNKFVYQQSNHKVERFALQSPGIAHDQLRLLRVHRGGLAAGQWSDGGQPGIPGHDALRDEFRQPGLGGGRRGPDPRLPGRGAPLLVQPQVSGSRRRREATRLDAEVAQGGHPRAPAEGGGTGRRPATVRSDCDRGERDDRGRSGRLSGKGGTPRPLLGPLALSPCLVKV